MTLTEFLRERSAEDEQKAEAVAEGRYSAEEIGYPMPDDLRRAVVRLGYEVEARRRIIDLHGDGEHECSTYDHNGEIDACTYVIRDDECSTLRLIALPYQDHPDYQPKWRI